MTDLFFSFQGRLNRYPYWLAVAFMTALMIALANIDFELGEPEIKIVGLVTLVALMVVAWASLALAAKRLHDRDKSNWWLVVFYVVPALLDTIGERLGGIGIVFTLVGLGVWVWGLVEVGFLRGTAGPNRYGPDPLDMSRAVAQGSQ
jgi:uncharacterized membrane protein YhaH (DUF805 family)